MLAVIKGGAPFHVLSKGHKVFCLLTLAGVLRCCFDWGEYEWCDLMHCLIECLIIHVLHDIEHLLSVKRTLSPMLLGTRAHHYILL